jgi:hypothetical protein
MGIVTVGTRNVSAESWAGENSVSAPSVETRISILPFFKIDEGTEIVGRRSLGIVSDTSPYLSTCQRLASRRQGDSEA